MSRYQLLKDKLAHREVVVGTTMTMLNNTLILEKMVRPDLDFVLFDAEHVPKLRSSSGRRWTVCCFPPLAEREWAELPSSGRGRVSRSFT